MKVYFFILIVFLSLIACKKETSINDEGLYNGTVVAYSPISVSKTNAKKIFAHVMPWFESKTSNSGTWGQHWTMANQNPDVIGPDGKRQIAAHFYPSIGPYASGDTNVIEYQLLLMKLSGIDGVFIDWPGKQNLYNYPFDVRNTERMVAMLQRVGLKFAIVYEDQNLVNVGANKISQAQTDMVYLQNNFFTLPYYEKIGSKPLLLVFGPQLLQTASDWTSVFSVLNPKPSFFTLWYESNDAGVNAEGEFAWIYPDYLTGLNSFYNNSYSGIKMASVYPGFKSFYALGGYGGPTWTINHNGTATFTATLDLALSKNVDYVQLNTWNDYGEGTIIEPTLEFGYSFLTTLQSKLGVASLTQSDLELIDQLFKKRKSLSSNTEAQKKLNQVFYYIVSLQMDKAKKLLNSI